MRVVQAKRILRKLIKKGCITHTMLLRIWEPDGVIPDEIFHNGLFYHRPEPPRPFEMSMGVDAYNKMNELLEDWAKEQNIKFEQ